VVPGTPTYTTAPRPAAVALGWAGYAPATAWVGYAPASSSLYPTVRPGAQALLPSDGTRRRAASLFVNRYESGLSYTLPAYREYGSGRQVPLAKPWLPLSP
jgi:hypothetical protein